MEGAETISNENLGGESNRREASDTGGKTPKGFWLGGDHGRV